MADLDDFFAKKASKAKKKGRAKLVISDVIPHTEEDLNKAKKKENEPQANPLDKIAVDETDSSEWQDWQEKETDLTDLLISKMDPTLKEPKKNPDGTIFECVDGIEKPGPWNRIEADAKRDEGTVEDADAASQPCAIVESVSKNIVEGKYVPPSMRAGAATEPLAPLRGRGYKKLAAPNITSDSDFPELGTEPPPKSAQSLQPRTTVANRDPAGTYTGGGAGGGEWSRVSRGDPGGGGGDTVPANPNVYRPPGARDAGGAHGMLRRPMPGAGGTAGGAPVSTAQSVGSTPTGGGRNSRTTVTLENKFDALDDTDEQTAAPGKTEPPTAAAVVASGQPQTQPAGPAKYVPPSMRRAMQQQQSRS